MICDNIEIPFLVVSEMALTPFGHKTEDHTTLWDDFIRNLPTVEVNEILIVYSRTLIQANSLCHINSCLCVPTSWGTLLKSYGDCACYITHYD